MTENQYVPDSVSPPGETLAELLEERGITQAQLSKQMGRPRKTINEILHGKAELTSETALQLEHVLHVPADFWVRREADYRAHLARKKEGASLKAQAARVLRGLPYRAMQKAGWIDSNKDRVSILRELLRFFRVGSFEQLVPGTLLGAAAFRRSDKYRSDPVALAAWLRRGEMLAELAPPGAYRREVFLDALKRIRPLTVAGPQEGLEKAQEECRKAGVIVLVVPELKGACVSGAARWVMGRPVIQLSLRYRTDDHLWFTLFHEAGHIVLHADVGQFLDEDKGPTSSKEVEANEFAKDTLVPPQEWRRFVESGRVTERAILQFSNVQGIAPGIVVGRLQHEKAIQFSTLNHLKRPVGLVAG